MQSHNTAADVHASSGKQLVVLQHKTHVDGGEQAGNAQDAQGRERSAGQWFHYSNLKVEAAIFLLIALTFAAMLGKDLVTSQQLVLTPQSGQFLPYTYGDQTNGGDSTISADPAKPLIWSCELRSGFQYPYCAYGLQLDAGNPGKGLDFSHYQDITLRLTYHGTARRLKLLLKTELPAALRDKIKNDALPISVVFNVADGENEIHLSRARLVTEQWWINSHQLAQDEARSQLDNVLSVAIGSSEQKPGHFDVSVQSLTFSGTYLSTAQWYLIILGVWLVLTGTFLVYRFLGLRRGYEARQRQQAEEAQALAVARAAAEASSAAKSQFLANMSHELRTPLNAILGYAQLLKDADLTEQQLSGIKTIHQSGEHLLTLITDILDIAKVEAGKMELLSAPVDVRACVFTVAQMIRLRAEEKGLRFTVEIGDDVPHNVIADQKRIRQVLINLLGNAVKFTDTGEVRLEVSTVSNDGVSANGGNVRLRFSIVDSGVGIREDQTDRIFRPFEQAGNAIDRSGGTGLGLSITHQIMQMMRGEIRVESTLGQGSRFIIEAPFPLAGSEPATGVTDGRDSRGPTADGADDAPQTMTCPSGDQQDRLLALARAGNMRAIRKEVPAILASGPEYKAFAERLDALAAAYQSPAVLRLVEQSVQQRTAA